VSWSQQGGWPPQQQGPGWYPPHGYHQPPPPKSSAPVWLVVGGVVFGAVVLAAVVGKARGGKRDTAERRETREAEAEERREPPPQPERPPVPDPPAGFIDSVAAAYLGRGKGEADPSCEKFTCVTYDTPIGRAYRMQSKTAPAAWKVAISDDRVPAIERFGPGSITKLPCNDAVDYFTVGDGPLKGAIIQWRTGQVNIATKAYWLGPGAIGQSVKDCIKKEG
jgi:hypothetical protein